MDKGFRRLALYSVAAAGISTIIVQIILLREFYASFNSVQVLGMALANWFLLTGIGFWIGRVLSKFKDRVNVLIIVQSALALLPFLMIFLLRVMRSPQSATSIFFFSLFLMLLYCLANGFLVSFFVSALQRGSSSTTRAYTLTALGDVMGALVFSAVLMNILKPFQVLFLIMSLNLVLALTLAFFSRKKIIAAVLAGLIILVFVLAMIDFENVTLSEQFDGHLIKFDDSKLGREVVIEIDNQTHDFVNAQELNASEGLDKQKEKRSPVYALFAIFLLFVALFKLSRGQDRAMRFTIFTTGFTAAGIVVIAMQAFHNVGKLYSMIGWLIFVFMFGLFFGGLVRWKNMYKMDIALIFSCFLAAALSFLSYVLLILVAVVAFVEAAQFVLALRNTDKTSVYVEDYAGAAVGTMIAVLILPLVGIIGTCLMLAFVNLASAFLLRR